MSTNKSVSLLKAIKPYKQGWRIQVRLIHSWRQKTIYGGDSLEMIFADVTGDKIHCTCKRTYIQRTQRDLRLGEWHMIDVFSLSNATGQYRTTNHTYKMSIIEDTKISKSPYVCDDKFFRFADFEEIGNGTLKTHFLIDVIGQVTSLRDIQTVQVSGKDKKKVEFRLLDSSGQSIACCLWGKYAEQLDDHRQQTKDPNMVCLIRFAKIGFYRGEVQVTNAFDASLILFNPELPETLALTNVEHNELALALIDPKKEKRVTRYQAEDWNDVDIKSISEINMATMEEDCKIICSIESIDTDWSWFYQGHDSCKKRAILIKSKSGNLASNEKPVFWCTNCHTNVTSVSPKFKLHLVVKDDTSTCKLMILDTIGKVIVGCEAVELWDGSYDEIEDPDVLPQPINDLVGLSFCFGVTLGSENVSGGSEIFLVSQVLSGDKLLQIETNSEPITHVTDGSSIMSGGEVSAPEKNSQSSEEGSSTPFSKRKEKDQLEQTSTSKKICTKAIKMEKIKDD
ncbi:replication protein A 70 kDa DNA-binding subunit B-like [Brassica rapa]|uniref:replication protein A 70 kDa DNA-binding subunit B-like n=1 Tax=Brassica campestris TaxID=3711 RepID=UPI0008725E69|nr:replication protein A 70 kDa DNA-binding subunit B-like [Brassica rapa]